MARNKAFDATEALHKAMQVFWKKGYHATSMEDLVTAMGINRASLYDTFGDKKQLYLSALKRFQADARQQNDTAMRRAANTPRAKLVAVLEASLEEALADPEQRGCLMANATAEMALLDEEVRQLTHGNLCALEVFLENLIAAGQETGEFRADLHAATAATFLMNYVHGMRVVTKTRHDPDRMRRGLEFALRSLDA
jgi:TetR/AcrR family transcriptional regulator, transcriptional repressor for nem operon